MSNRKKAEALILQFMLDLDPSGKNVEKYKTHLKNMSDVQFKKWMTGMRDGTQGLVLFAPSFESGDITTENNLKVAEKYGIKMFEKLKFLNNKNIPDYQSEIEYLIVDLPYRRQSQNIVKKISVPDDNKVIDQLTFQPTGDSKGAKISYPELQVLTGMGLDNTIEELTKFRGGDRGGFNAYNAMAMRYGSVNLRTIRQYSTGVESTKALKSMLLSVHLKLDL